MSTGEQTSDWDYELPEELIAEHPTERRDASRLLMVPKSGGPVRHRHFRDITDYLREGDLLVMNDSRVLPARLFGKRLPGGGACEALLLRPIAETKGDAERWTALMRPGKKLKPGSAVEFAPGFGAVVEESLPGGEKVLRFASELPLSDQLERHGNMPLPPYILARRGEKESRPEDRERYQTVYAREQGSVAAPTAGLHFTEELLAKLRDRGVDMTWVTLHVGAGTFQPITTERITEHPMHEEIYQVAPETAEKVTRAKREGRRVVAVGTTSVRTLESAAPEKGVMEPRTESTSLMIAPGYEYKLVDALITNFHLPRSTLLLLVGAMIGRERLLEIYEEAVRERYRFYSYGDAMFIADIED